MGDYGCPLHDPYRGTVLEANGSSWVSVVSLREVSGRWKANGGGDEEKE